MIPNDLCTATAMTTSARNMPQKDFPLNSILFRKKAATPVFEGDYKHLRGALVEVCAGLGVWDANIEF